MSLSLSEDVRLSLERYAVESACLIEQDDLITKMRNHLQSELQNIETTKADILSKLSYLDELQASVKSKCQTAESFLNNIKLQVLDSNSVPSADEGLYQLELTPSGTLQGLVKEQGLTKEE